MLIKQRRFNEAIRKLNAALEKDNDFIEVHLQLAFSYDLLRELNAQQYHLEQVMRIAPNTSKYKNVYYSLGKVYFGKGEYVKSREMISTIEQMGIDNQRIKNDVDRLNVNLDFAVENIQNPIDIDPQPMPDILNSFPLQYFPVLTADEKTIIYTVRMGVKFHDDENIVTSSMNEDGTWNKPVSISPNINSQFNEGTCAISADGRTLIFTTCEGRKSMGGCDLYITTKTGDEWSVPQNLGPNINTRAWESQPTLSADGRMLFFISDRYGGLGKRDIWMSRKDAQNQWTKAVNLGDAINTRDDEVSPFIHVNGTTLFFASKGYPGFGGFDLYKSDLQDSVWSEPLNLGYPLNTHEDQVSLFVSTSGKSGYYSFERKWQTDENQSFLYTFDFPEEGIIENKSTYLTGFVYDSDTGEPVEARIELFELGSEEPISIFASDPVSGKYFTVINENSDISLYVTSPGYLFNSEDININTLEAASLERDIFLNPIKEGRQVQLRNIFFELNSAKLSNESRTELLKVFEFLTENIDVKIHISGHTDDQGSVEYNLDLSNKRARAVYDFMLEKGIKQERITYKGYGESMPVSDSMTEEGRKLNRRIEFSIRK